jgi:DNA polymerase III gamma/tau subunit
MQATANLAVGPSPGNTPHPSKTDISGQSAFDFPQSLSERYRPRRIAEFVGLDRPKKVLRAFLKRPTAGAWLFVGPSGVGKSTMALALAEELQAELHKIPSQKCNAQTIEDTVRHCWYAPMTPGGFHVVLADEADQMTPAAQLALLSKLDSTDPAPSTIWIFTANDTERLERRFLSRCKMLEFSSYGMAGEIVAYLSRIWHAEGGKGNCPDLSRVVKESRNTIRDCLQTLEVELLAT